MKYFLATLYLIAGIVLPFVYINVVETTNIARREWILLVALFIFCGMAGINLLFANKANKAEEPAQKPKPSPFKTPAQRKIPQPMASQGMVVTAPRSVSGVPMTSGRYQEPPAQKPREHGSITYPTREKPDLKALMEDVKNFIKLESWLMALQKANEIIHFYPDSPEADKVRGNINFLIQKVKGHE
ncbi:MAG: hypothetical protein HZA49_07385 [Planctomycetes bacterium]|nr:hypothetical protein [Planctomycetota bacterium]